MKAYPRSDSTKNIPVTSGSFDGIGVVLAANNTALCSQGQAAIASALKSLKTNTGTLQLLSCTPSELKQNGSTYSVSNKSVSVTLKLKPSGGANNSYELVSGSVVCSNQ